MARRRSLWRRLRRATRSPRNAFLAASIWRAVQVIGLLPVPVGLALGRALGAVAHALLARPRGLARRHVALAFPERSAAEVDAIVRGCFRHAGTSFAELALWRKLAVRPGYVEAEGLDEGLATLGEGRGLIAVTGHVGNWELLAATLAARGVPLTVVARRVNDARFDALILRFRRAVGVEVVLRDDARFQAAVRDALARDRVVALLIDQDTRGAGVHVPFFGRLARTPPGAAILALRTRAPVVTAFIERRRDGGHRIRVTPIPLPDTPGRGQVTALTAELTAAIEAQIRRAPAEWVWWHERWRRGPGEPVSPLLAGGRVVPLARPED
ncbi:MAG: lysophospholipid acyltransferase family protein [Candidatus Binatia bacterium]